MTMGAGSFGRASSATAGTSSAEAAPSDFRISMAPVSISVAVLVGAAGTMLASLSTAGAGAGVGAAGWWSGAAMSWAASSSFSRPAASPGTMSPDAASPATSPLTAMSGLATSTEGARLAISIAAAGSSGVESVTSGFDCVTRLDAAVSAPSGCGFCIIANRLANSARVSASAPRLSPGVSPFGDRAGPAPSAPIVFIDKPRFLMATGHKLPPLKDISGVVLQKGCQMPTGSAAAGRHGGVKTCLAGKLARHVVSLAAFHGT